MSNELMVTKFEVAGEMVELNAQTVKNYLVRGNGNVTDQELVMFMNLCKYQKLNPFLNEAYLIKFGQQPAQIITSKEAFMKRAEANANYNGMKAGIIVERNGEIVELEGAVKLKSDELIGGWCMVFRKDRQQPITVKLSVDEFNKKQATWKEMPLNMIRKTAIVNALREAFPDNLGAMYTEEEKQEHTLSSIPEYNQNERKETKEEVIVDAEIVEESNMDKLKEQMKTKLKQLNIVGKKSITDYLKVNGIGNDPTEQDLVGLIAIMDQQIKAKQQEQEDMDELFD